jgi:hypothetical protein
VDGDDAGGDRLADHRRGEEAVKQLRKQGGAGLNSQTLILLTKGHGF